MTNIICAIFFVVLSGMAYKFYAQEYGYVRVPMHSDTRMKCNGLELLVIFMYTTGLIGIMPVLSVRLAVLEVICVLGILKATEKVQLSAPLKIFLIFLSWLVIGIFYTPNFEFGIRMILKYIYPFLFCLFTSVVVSDKEVFLKCAFNARWAGLAAFIIAITPGNFYIFRGVLWNNPAIVTNFICLCMFSLAMAYYASAKYRIKNILWTIFFILPSFYWVIRTDIFGIGLALSTFFFLKYKFKALPLIAAVGCLGLAAMFYVPQVKAKMYYRPDEVTITDFLTGNVDENNINTSGRKKGWEDVQANFFENHELTGSGTGRVQTYFYTEVSGWQRGGQLHNDFLVLLCDNGLIGLLLFVIAYLAIALHCLIIYSRSESKIVRICALTAGASLIGIMVTMYSDNTISYSMATLSYPWGFYGMALGLSRKEKSSND